MKKIEIGNLEDFRLVGGLDVHENKVLFTVSEMNLKENDYFSRIYVYDGKKVKQFSSGPKDSNPKISPNGDFVIFASETKKVNELRMAPARGGESRVITRFKCRIDDFEISPNGRSVGVLSPTDLEKKEKKKQGEDVHIIKEIPFWYDGLGWIYGKREHVFLVDTESGRKREIMRGKLRVVSFKFMPNKPEICFMAQEDREKKPLISDLFVIDLRNEKIRKLTDSTMLLDSLEIIDDKRLVLRAKNLERGHSSNMHIYLFNIETGEMKRLTQKLDRYAKNLLNCDVRIASRNPLVYRNGWVYYLATDGPRASIFRVGLEGEIERVVGGDRSVETFGIGNFLAFIAQNSTVPTELYMVKSDRSENNRSKEKIGERRITKFNEWSEEYALSKLEYFQVKTDNGVSIDSWVMKPVGFEEGKKYPTILEIHGGPQTTYGHSFLHEFQLLTSVGFAVIFSNPRGSGGYSEEFADIRGHYGEGDYRDLMRVVDVALKKFGFIDMEKMGVTGGSYGGFMTNWIISRTDRFRAAVTQRSVNNWISFFGTSDEGYHFGKDQIGQDPWINLGAYWKKSPLKYAPNVNTPLLMIHSTKDYRCFLAESLQFFTALRYFGKNVELALFPEENHDLSRKGKPKHRAKRLELIVNWFRDYLM